MNVFIFILEVEGVLALWEVEDICFFLLKVEGFCYFFWMLKVIVHTFGCWKFLLLLFDVKGYCFYSWMIKVLTSSFRCWKFLFLLLDIEGFYFFNFYVMRLNFHYILIHQHQNYVYKVRFFLIPKIIIQFTLL